MSGQENGICKTQFVHAEAIQKVHDSTPEEETLYRLSDFFRMLGDTTRMRILHALFVTEMCVCDLSEILGVSQSAVSHQLKTLRQFGVVTYRREGKAAFYSLKDEHVKQIIDIGLQHADES
jgi:ArsR family transcriptional regulator